MAKRFFFGFRPLKPLEQTLLHLPLPSATSLQLALGFTALTSLFSKSSTILGVSYLAIFSLSRILFDYRRVVFFRQACSAKHVDENRCCSQIA